MGLIADLKEVTEPWKLAPWRVKAMLLIPAFLSASSIASLSESVFKWKGFLLDGVKFYQEWISIPISRVLVSIFADKVPNHIGDFTVLLGLLAVTTFRIQRFSGKKLYEPDILIIPIAYYGFVVQFASSDLEELNLWLIWVSYFLIAALSVFVTKRAVRLLLLVWLFSPFVCVGVLAAINSGLTKSAA